LVDKPPILLIDELEAGLEPHRQRVAAKLAKQATREGQAFIVTHAPAVVSALADDHHWQMSPATASQIPQKLSGTLFKVQAEAAFAKLSVVCEGETELGLVRPLWSHYTGRDVEECGVALINAGGQTKALAMLADLVAASLPCAGFVDNENELSGTRARLEVLIPLFTWEPLQMPEEALAKWISFERLEAFLQVIADARLMYSTRYEVHMIVALIRKELRCEEHLTLGELIDRYEEEALRDALYQVLKLGVLKYERIARAVAEWLIATGIPSEINAALEQFFNRCKNSL
jgi:predicted ATP-dependent endonuclease of OLD family